VGFIVAVQIVERQVSCRGCYLTISVIRLAIVDLHLAVSGILSRCNIIGVLGMGSTSISWPGVIGWWLLA